jgi:serine/threonine protein phosphatase PrpC
MVKNILATYFNSTRAFKRLDETELLDEKTVYKLLSANEYSMIKHAFKKAEQDLQYAKFDCSMSGCTAVMIFIVDGLLICANAGDSRAILVVEKEGTHIVQLSRDHKPDLEDEKKRILKQGGFVEKYIDHGVKLGPFRVWMKNETYPGLAMSRSIGDFMASSVGVTCEPEICECVINEYCKYIVMASDGLWEFVSNDDVMNIVKPFYPLDIEGAVNALIKEATVRWNKVKINVILDG